MALLQVVEDDLHLCAGKHEESDGGDSYAADVDRGGWAGDAMSFLSGGVRGSRFGLPGVNVLDPAAVPGNNSTQPQEEKEEDDGPREINVTPTHGVPSE